MRVERPAYNVKETKLITEKALASMGLFLHNIFARMHASAMATAKTGTASIWSMNLSRKPGKLHMKVFSFIHMDIRVQNRTCPAILPVLHVKCSGAAAT